MPKLTAPRLNAPMVDWALWWASRGWAVFPIWAPVEGEHCSCGQTHRDSGKHPIIKAGFQAGTADAAQIRAWWIEHPEANIGATPPVGQFVIDIDGPLEDGLEFPPTQTHTTGKGEHRVYKQNPEQPLDQKQGAGRYWENVDTRTHGKGYIVLPPSRHQSGTRYVLGKSLSPEVFPTELCVVAKPVKKAPKSKAVASEFAALLALPRDSPELGDDAMTKVAGYIARWVPTKDDFDALLSVINDSLAEPLHPTALAKKRGIYDKHVESQVKTVERVLDDESQGWLFDREPHGYNTVIENRDGTVDYMAATDFSLVAHGVIVSPGYAKRVFIVDCHLSDGSVILNQKIDTDTMCDTPRLKKWLARRGMNMYDNTKDPRRGVLGQRLIKRLESQDPVTLDSRDHYGWCADTQAFLVEQGEVTAEGLRPFTKVYPDDKLRTDSPAAFQWDADLSSARDWLGRVLGLQPEVEAAKVGAWAMMLLLRGQWRGLLPGLLVQASAGTGKTRFFQLLFKLLGSTNDGESLTVPAMRDKLMGSTSNAVWLDDVHLDDRQQQLMRGALTNGKISHKEQSLDGWVTIEKQMRASIVVSGEGVDWYRQKALRDRFIEASFDKSVRTVDADKLVTEEIGRGSGALLEAVLAEAGRLPELEALREGVSERDDHARTTLRIGARILDAVLGTGHKWTRILDGWYLGEAREHDQGQASENVLKVIPTLWTRMGMPESSGFGSNVMALWFDPVARTFWVHAQRVADVWNQTQRGLSDRERQLTDAASITRELDACDAGPATNKPTKAMQGQRTAVKYRQLPAKYSRMALDTIDYAHEDED